MNHRDKPYFSTQQLDKIVASFEAKMESEKLPVDDNLRQAVRAYAAAGKSMYENNFLRNVLDGKYEIHYKGGEAIYSIVKPAALTGIKQYSTDELNNIASDKEMVALMKEQYVKAGVPQAVEVFNALKEELKFAVSQLKRLPQAAKNRVGKIDLFLKKEVLV